MKLALFDHLTSGHHSEYLLYLLQNLPNHFHLEILVPSEMWEQHQYLPQYKDRPNINVIALDLSQELLPQISAYLTKHEPQIFSFLFVDKFLFNIKQPIYNFIYNHPKTQFTGILFRAENHYAPKNAKSIREFTVRMLKKKIFHNLSQCPNWHTLYCLDPFAVPYFNKYYPQLRATALADPMYLTHTKTRISLRSHYNIPLDRQIYLLIGALQDRKGILETIEALKRSTLETQNRICLLLVGKVWNNMEKPLEDALQHLPKSIHIILDNKFISHEYFPDYLLQSDVILMPYLNHVGSSGILIRAASLGKPVICQNYGLIGRWTKKYELGLTTNSLDITALSKALSTTEIPFNPNKAALFANINTPENFAHDYFTKLIE